MKRFLLYVAMTICLTSGIVFSQTINIHKTDGSIHQFYISDIDSITFSLIPTEGLLAYYPFNGNANDESGNGNHGTLLGGAIITDILILGDNNTDALSLPHTILNGISAFTFASWLKINNLHTTGTGTPSNTLISSTASFHPSFNGFNFVYEKNIEN